MVKKAVNYEECKGLHVKLICKTIQTGLAQLFLYFTIAFSVSILGNN